MGEVRGGAGSCAGERVLLEREMEFVPPARERGYPPDDRGRRGRRPDDALVDAVRIEEKPTGN